MKTIVIAKFGGFDEEERTEIGSYAIDIYKFFKFLSYDFFDLITLKNILGFKKIVDFLSKFLPFVERNYDTIINFDEDSSEEFLSEIDILVLKEKHFNYEDDEASITAEDIERYSKLSEDFSELIDQAILCDANPQDFLEFLKNRGLLASFYNEYCCWKDLAPHNPSHLTRVFYCPKTIFDKNRNSVLQPITLDKCIVSTTQSPYTFEYPLL